MDIHRKSFENIVYLLYNCNTRQLTGNLVSGPRTCSQLKFCNVTANQYLSKFVPRSSYPPDNLYPDGKNHAMLRSLRLQGDPTLNRLFYSAAFTRSATFTHFIAGPLGLRFHAQYHDSQRVRRYIRDLLTTHIFESRFNVLGIISIFTSSNLTTKNSTTLSEINSTMAFVRSFVKNHGPLRH